MRKTLALLAFLAIAPALAFGQQAAPAAAQHPAQAGKALPTMSVSTQHANHKDAAIGVTPNGDTVYRGPRGGEYYFGPNGRKRYLPKQ